MTLLAGIPNLPKFSITTKVEEDLSDLLDTHQDRPTEVRRRDQVKIITTPWTETQTLRAARVTVEAGVKRFHFRASRTCSHQQGWRFCGSFKEFRKGTSTLK
ncbi:Nucleic acid-binding OB-fold [Penicillium fimorum]|uniref:Nucleic acid-binding OB-fold n=1 Tax=Penicillium fimorum TaxID=1882269 RepID=A0A9X0C4H7_9EURO|nr:Nucleic acid-binding OB-fold [Penicillium fimorum]